MAFEDGNLEGAQAPAFVAVTGGFCVLCRFLVKVAQIEGRNTLEREAEPTCAVQHQGSSIVIPVKIDK